MGPILHIDIPIRDHIKKDQVGWGVPHSHRGGHERLSRYKDAGLCPVVIGQRLHGDDLHQRDGTNPKEVCYSVLSKLGHGSFATVWLVRDVRSRGSYFAMKVLSQAESTEDNAEMRIMAKLGKLEAAFFYQYGKLEDPFLCLVMAAHGPSLSGRDVAKVGPPADVPSITAFIRSLFQKVVQMHDLGIVHGDLSPNNVVLGLHEDALKPASLKNTIGCERIPVVYQDADGGRTQRPNRRLPPYLVRRKGPGLLVKKTDMSLVDIIDFGRAFEGPVGYGVRGTPTCAAPEVEFEQCTTAFSDLWSLGCVIASGLTDVDLFDEEQDYVKYIEANPSGQIIFLESHILRNEFLRAHRHMRNCVVVLLWCLIQVVPEYRNREAAGRIVDRLTMSCHTYGGDIANQHIRAINPLGQPDATFHDYLGPYYESESESDLQEESESEESEE